MIYHCQVGMWILYPTRCEEHVNLANAARPWGTTSLDRRSVQFYNSRRYRVTVTRKKPPQTRHALRCKSSCENSRVSMAVGRGGNFQLTPLSPSRGPPCARTWATSIAGRSSLSREQQKKKIVPSEGHVLSAVQQQQPRYFFWVKVDSEGERLGTITPRRRKRLASVVCPVVTEIPEDPSTEQYCSTVLYCIVML